MRASSIPLGHGIFLSAIVNEPASRSMSSA